MESKVNELQFTLDSIASKCSDFPILFETTDSKHPGIDRVRTLQKQTADVQSIVDKSIAYRKKKLRKGEYEDLLELIREAVDLKKHLEGLKKNKNIDITKEHPKKP